MALSAFFAAVFIHLLAAASPGPAVMMTARVSVAKGLRSGVFLALGVATGAILWAVAALFGLDLLFKAAPVLFITTKILGGLFLVWMAIGMWRHAKEPLDTNTAQGTLPPTGRAAFLTGVTTQLANPKPAVFFGAVFVSTLPQDSSTLSIVALLVVIFANEFLCNALIARMFSTVHIRDWYARQKRIIDRVFGSILGALGLKIMAG